MNDPVTNVEIEDVLSSIRRLVSEDARVRPLGWKPDPAEAEAVATPVADAGRLVLTPALRVTEDAQPVTEAPDSDVSEADVFEPEADAAMIADEAMDASPDATPDEGALGHLSAVGDQETATVDEAFMADAPEESFLSANDDEADSHDIVDHDPVAEVEAQAWSPQQSDPLVLSEATDEAMVWEDHHDDAEPDTAPLRFMAEVVSDDMSKVDEATLHPVVEEADADSDPQAAGFIFASTRDGSGRESAASAADMEQVKQGDETDAMDDRAFLLSEDETVLDEETLREMVAEIVRQELQGALGERITRNVRKLVRREIHRAMTSHELE